MGSVSVSEKFQVESCLPTRQPDERDTTMHLVQILLPIHDNSQEAFPMEDYKRVRKELTEKFGGVTVYTHAPAKGHWKLNDNHTSRDDIVIFEVMASELDAAWWRNYRHDLEKRFRQDVIVVRAQQTRLL